MKKHFFKSLLLLVALTVSQAQAQGTMDTLDQNTDDTTVTQFNSVSCNAGGIHTSNSYYRSFTLAHLPPGDFIVGNVRLGVEVSNGVGAGDVPVDVNFYFNDAIATVVHNPLGNEANADASISTTVPGDGSVDATVIDIPVTGVTIPDSATSVVVEIFTPGSDGPNPLGQSFFVGSNPNGQSSPTFLAAAGCGVTTPTATGALGFPTMHMILIVDRDMGGGGCMFALGDVNNDGIIDLTDISAFVAAVTGGPYVCEADINADGMVTLLDISLFVAILTGGG